MPAHVPRRSFARPFIVTVAAAASAAASIACEETVHDNPPRPRDGFGDPAASATPAGSAPPVASAPSLPRTRHWDLTRDEQRKTCIIANRDCDTGKPCDQTPSAYACPDDVHHFPSIVVQDEGSPICHAIWDPGPISCPPGASCNPPPTQVVEVPCPK
jgi:hypothetical protein